MTNFATRISSLFALAVLACTLTVHPPEAKAQATTSSTSFSTAVGASDLFVNVASASGISAPGSLNQTSTVLYADKEEMRVTSVSGTYIGVERGADGTKQTSHSTSAVVWLGPPNYFRAAGSGDPAGSCTSTAFTNLPRVAVDTGNVWTCPTTGPSIGQWTRSAVGDTVRFTDAAFYVPPTACWFTPTTYTDTVAMAAIGASAASSTPVLQTTTNSATGTETLVCTIAIPTRLTSGKGVTITDVTAFYGIQTTASTSMTVAMNSITFPAAAASETASTVTPVAISGSVTNNTVTSGLGTTTAGGFWSVKSTLATPLAVNTDLNALVYALGFVSTTSGVHVINTPGLLVHYTESIL